MRTAAALMVVLLAYAAAPQSPPGPSIDVYPPPLPAKRTPPRDRELIVPPPQGSSTWRLLPADKAKRE